MPGEKPRKLTLNERITHSSIHQWASFSGIGLPGGKRAMGVEQYMDAAHMPKHIRPAFHELLIERGKYGWDISDADAEKFRQEVPAVLQSYMLTPDEANLVMGSCFVPVVGQWMFFNKGLPRD